jgi:hypothetical protein
MLCTRVPDSECSVDVAFALRTAALPTPPVTEIYPVHICSLDVGICSGFCVGCLTADWKELRKKGLSFVSLAVLSPTGIRKNKRGQSLYRMTLKRGTSRCKRRVTPLSTWTYFMPSCAWIAHAFRSCFYWLRKNMYKLKEIYCKVKFSCYRPSRPFGIWKLRLRIFLTFGIVKVVRSSPLRTGRLYSQEFSWYSFLEAESTPGHMVPSVATEKNPQRPRDLRTSSTVL